MAENQDIRPVVRTLIRQERWDDALKLLQRENRSGDLLVMQAQVEAALGLRTKGEAGMLDYIYHHANQYSHNEIARRLLAIGHSEVAINNAFVEFGLNPIFANPRTQSAADNQMKKNLLTEVAIACGVILVCIVVLPVVFLFVLSATCRYG